MAPKDKFKKRIITIMLYLIILVMSLMINFINFLLIHHRIHSNYAAKVITFIAIMIFPLSVLLLKESWRLKYLKGPWYLIKCFPFVEERVYNRRSCEPVSLIREQLVISDWVSYDKLHSNETTDQSISLMSAN